MKFFRSKFIAILVAAVAVFSSTVISAEAKLRRACAEEEAEFFDTWDDPYYYFETAVDAAARLATLGGHYESLSPAVEPLRAARAALVAALESRDVSDVYNAALALEQQGALFNDAAYGIEMSEADKDLYEDSIESLTQLQRRVSWSDYNEDINEFLEETYRRFPARLVAELFSIDPPELYTATGK